MSRRWEQGSVGAKRNAMGNVGNVSSVVGAKHGASHAPSQFTPILRFAPMRMP
jgi:hypothetical protein